MIYTLIGEEAFLLRRSLEKLLKERVSAESRDFNFDSFDGNGLQARKIIEAAQTLPVFAPQRVVLVKNAQELKKGECDILEPFLKKVPETTDLIFVTEKVDRRFSFWQKLLEIAKVREFKPLGSEEAPRWLIQEAKEAGYEIACEAATWMTTALGTDLFLLHTALEKLFLFKKDQKEISLSDVESCVVPSSWKNIFEITNAVGERNLARALKLFRRMEEAGESPIAMVALLARHFRILSQVREGSHAGIPFRFLKEYQQQVRRFRTGDLEEKRERLFQADWALKSSPLQTKLLFERLLFELCR